MEKIELELNPRLLCDPSYGGMHPREWCKPQSCKTQLKGLKHGTATANKKKADKKVTPLHVAARNGDVDVRKNLKEG
jgi:hypothetical protein